MTEREICEYIAEHRHCNLISCDGYGHGVKNEGTPCPLNGEEFDCEKIGAAQAWLDAHPKEEAEDNKECVLQLMGIHACMFWDAGWCYGGFEDGSAKGCVGLYNCKLLHYKEWIAFFDRKDER